MEIAERRSRRPPTSTPCSSVIVRLPTRRISSRSCVATSTVVPRALISRNRFITSSARSGSRFPVGSSASTSAGSLMSARAIATRCCSPPESSMRKRVHAVLKADPLQHLERLLPLLIGRLAEHARHERDVLEDGLRRDQLEVLEDEADGAAVVLHLRSASSSQGAAIDDEAGRRSGAPGAAAGAAACSCPRRSARQEDELAAPDREREIAQARTRRGVYTFEGARAASNHDRGGPRSQRLGAAAR